MLYFIFKGGPIMIPIILSSILGLGIILERLLVFHGISRLDMEAFCRAVFKQVSDGKAEDALRACRQKSDFPLPAMFAVALENRHLPRPDLEKMMERVANRYVKVMEKRLAPLVSIVGVAPLLGFLGTITGLINAFVAWEKAGNDITVSALASGMYVAMITTAAGLMVAIPCYLCYNYFISRIKFFVHQMEDYSGELLELMAREKVQ
jgi:biopolymer transport protein ExbB